MVEIKLIELPNPFQVQRNVANEQIDLGLSVLPLVSEGLIANQYTQTDYTILLNREHHLANQKAVKLTQLKIEKWIDQGPEATLFYGQLEEVCRNAGFYKGEQHSKICTIFYYFLNIGRGLKGCLRKF